MPSIAPDIAEVLAELGTLVQVYPPGNDFSTYTEEYLDPEGYVDHSTIFTRMFTKKATINAETAAVIGSIIKIRESYWLVTNKVGSDFENSVIENELYLYLCTNIVDVFDYSDVPQYDADSQLIDPFTIKAESVRGCLVEKSIDVSVVVNEDISIQRDYQFRMYVANSIAISESDRLTAVDGTNYKVVSVLNNLFPGLKAINLAIDER